ncbi:MAG: flagellar hook basal-body protein [bacterium]
MLNAMRLAAAGAEAQTVRQDIIANNLANLNTGAFKRAVPIFKGFPLILADKARNASSSVQLQETYLDRTPGSLVESGNLLDLAIAGEGSFVVENDSGVKSTRRGDLKIGSDGFLTTGDGCRVLGKDGPIKISGKKVEFTEKGQVVVDGEEIETLRMEKFSGTVLSGYLESSNVEMVREMVSMIEATRTYEAALKVVQTADELLGKAVNDLGRLK